jgi:hypothetical protein
VFTYSAICDVPEETLLFAVKGTWRANLLFYISMQSPGLWRTSPPGHQPGSRFERYWKLYKYQRGRCFICRNTS